jgi:ribosome-associated protein
MTTIVLRGESITLAQAVKAAGLADSGGQAKHLVRGGTVLVNGQVETQPGRQLVAGDSFRVADGPEWRVVQYSGAGDSSDHSGET